MRLSRHSWLRAIAVTLCVAVGFVLSNQTAVELVDIVAHGIGHDHAPNPLAGAVLLCEHNHDHDAGNDHHHGRHQCDGHDKSEKNEPVAHQHAYASIVYLIAVPPAITPPLQTSFLTMAEPRGLDRLDFYRLERPPKALIARNA